jgi:hypothetical protein
MLAGGKKELMLLAELAPEVEPALAPILEDWKRLSSSGKKSVSLDQICKTRKIDPYHFLGVIAEAAIKYRDNASVIVAAMNLPKIVEKSIKFAQKKDGFKDREALMKHGGFLPVPSGNTFVNTLQTKVETNVEQPGSVGHLPSFEATVGAIDVE